MNSKEIYAPILSLSRVRGGSANSFSGTVARRKIVDGWVIHHVCHAMQILQSSYSRDFINRLITAWLKNFSLPGRSIKLSKFCSFYIHTGLVLIV